MFEDRLVLYHGSYITRRLNHRTRPRLSALGFGRVSQTFFKANQAIGRRSSLRLFLGEAYPNEVPPRDLSLSRELLVRAGCHTSTVSECARRVARRAAGRTAE